MLSRRLNSEMSLLLLYVLISIITQCVGQPTAKYPMDGVSRVDRLEMEVQLLNKQTEMLQRHYRVTAAKLNEVINQLGQYEIKLENAVTKVLTSTQKSSRGLSNGAFSANSIDSDGGGVLRTQRGKAIIYHRTSVNDGGHYNTSTGLYTCPLTGLYFFSYSLFATGLSVTSGILRKGDKYGAEVMYKGGKSLSLSNADILECAAGETVYVHSIHGAHLQNWPGLNIFSGFLISEKSTSA